MTRAVPRVPLVVLPDPRTPPRAPSLPVPVRRAAGRALAALDRVCDVAGQVIERRRGIDAALADAAARTGTLADELARAAPAADAGPASVAVHEYFGVRTAALDPEQIAAGAAAVAHRGLADLTYAPVDVNDLAAEVAALRRTVAETTGVTDPAADDLAAGGAAPDGAGNYRPDGDGLTRWIVAHHVYFLLNVRATTHLHEALRALERGATARAARYLSAAAGHVRGFTAAMMHSAALPARYYTERVRHTMAPPAAPMNLTGRLQPEHKTYRAALDVLLDALPQPYAELAEGYPELAAARTALLDADLIDIERHVCVAGALVGGDHSLVQPDGGEENAVAILRLMRHLRAARYCPLVPFGDRFAAGAAPVGAAPAGR